MLKENTYRKYKKTGKQLLFFVFRMVYLGKQPTLHCLLANAQSAGLAGMASAARVIVQQGQDVGEELRAARQNRSTATVAQLSMPLVLDFDPRPPPDGRHL